jgi:hypothetical protein
MLPGRNTTQQATVGIVAQVVGRRMGGQRTKDNQYGRGYGYRSGGYGIESSRLKLQISTTDL